MICLELKHRFLTLDDLPAIRELSDSMGMWNDPKIGETAERRIRDPLCDLYGAFARATDIFPSNVVNCLKIDF